MSAGRSHAQRLFARIHAGGDALAFVCEDAEITWTELDERSRRYAQALAARGVQPGDRVALVAGPSIDNVVALLGHYRAGAVHVPINTRYRRGELEHVLRDSGAALVVCDVAGGAALDELDDPPAQRLLIDDANAKALGTVASVSTEPTQRARSLPADDALALMIYTSGTTGPSKGVCHDFASVVGSMLALTTAWQWSERDHQVLGLPLFHVHGLCIGVHGALLHGAQTTLLRRFSPAAVHQAFAPEGAGQRATLFMGVPTMYAMLLEWLEAEPLRAEPLRAARLFTAGSAALSARDFRRFESLTGHRILERYGMSETLISLSNPYEGERRPGAVGRAVPGYEVRVVDELGAQVGAGEVGEIRVRGVGMMRGYWQLPGASEASFEGGWFKTGDIARVGADGYLSIEGRSSVDIIKSGGFKISAREIEEALLESGELKEVAVLGVPDAKWGERIVCALVPTATAPSRTDAQWCEHLVNALAGELADYKRPRAAKVIEAVPKNALGKVQKHRLKALFGA